MDYRVMSIDKKETYPWLLKKHYAHRVPSISYSFGLYEQNELVGVVTFGMPPNYIEMKAWEPFELLELNRLVINDGLPKNTASFFISRAIKMIPINKVIISYSDLKYGHYGYIYQATNWLYTGIGGEGQTIYIMKNGKEYHQRHEKDLIKDHIERIEKTVGKARYYYFHADRKAKKKMRELLRFEILPYPKGDHKRYDSSYEPSIQQTLF